MFIFHEAGLHRGEEIWSEGQIGGSGLIVGISGFLWLRGECLFRGGVVIKVVVRAREVFLGVCIYEVFVYEFGVLQGAGDRNE